MTRRRIVDPAPATAPIIMPWEDFQAFFARHHKQGEHVAIVAPTGGGKSVVAFELAKIVGTRKARDGRPSRVTVLGSKPNRDDTLMALHRAGWPIITKWPPKYGQEHCIVWPRGGTLSQSSRRQRVVYVPLLDAIHSEGGQTVVIDEEAHFEEPQPEGLGLRGLMGPFWSGARSNKLTLIAATQRPRNVTRLMWSEPSWIIILRPEDQDDLKRVAELSGRKDEVLEIVQRLGGFEFLCVQRQRNGRRALIVSKVQVQKGRRRGKVNAAN
jgi:hypothetical protein